MNLPEIHRPGQVETGPGRTPAVRTGGLPTRPAAPTLIPASVSAPVYDPRKLTFGTGGGRDHWWNELSPKVRDRIEAVAGPRIEWWAFQHASERDRAYAVVLGPRALVVTKPERSNTGSPTQKLYPYRFVPGTLKHATVIQRPVPTGVGGGRGGTDRGLAVAARGLPITGDMRGFLGNLPAEAQERLQGPFLGDKAELLRDSDYYYHGSDEDLNVWCYLAGSNTVTFISGRRVAAAGAPPHAASWDLTCRHARVAAG